MPLSKSTRDVVFINTGPRESRVRMLKSVKDLEKMKADDQNFVVPDFFEKCEKRQEMDTVCLADFVAVYNEKGKQTDGSIKMAKREKSKVIRYVRYSYKVDPANFFREQCLLFLPWRNEQTDIENQNCQQLYEENFEVIRENQKRYVHISDEDIEDMFKNLDTNDDELSSLSTEDLLLIKELQEQNESIDILEQGGVAKPKKKEIVLNRYFSPKKFPKDEILKTLGTHNAKQRTIVMHVLKCLKTEQHLPLRIFLSGAAGVGKSTVINALYQLTCHHFDNVRGQNPDSVKVLLTAFSGKAASVINGTTLHTAFALPVNQFGGELTTLSNDIANTIRSQLVNLKLIIIDEISMCGAKVLHWVNQRLIQITGRNEHFGGISVIVVGDLHQLPPVGDQKCFKPFENPNNNPIGKLLDSVSILWQNFQYFELTEVMRQKDDLNFVNALNRLVIGQMTMEDIQLIESRRTHENDVPANTVRLCKTNDAVDSYNMRRISEMPGDLVKFQARDSIIGKISKTMKTKKLQTMKNMPKHQTFGLPYNLHLKIGIRYMITINIDIGDGLVNGVSGILKHIEFEENSTVPKILYIQFESDQTGQKMRREHESNMENKPNIDKNWVPIKQISKEISMSKNAFFQAFRKQFPVTPAEAYTIHKSQGSTYQSVCVDMRSSLSRELLYVALSRVIKLSNFYIVGRFVAPRAPPITNETIVEINRLKTEMPLKICYNTLEEKHIQVIAYHNVTSFQKYSIHITNDEWYRKCEILILTETRTKESHKPTVPGFRLIHQSDEDKAIGKRGVLVFAKPYVSIHLINYDLKFFRTKPSHHSEIFLFQTKNALIITGYKSPSTPAKTLKNQITSTMNLVQSINCDKCIYIGDFNFDISEKDTLTKFMNNFNMQSILDEVTTDNNTQIDVVFANFQHIQAGAYESYFSDHKPIVCMITYQLKELQIKLDRYPLKHKLISKSQPQVKLSPVSPAKLQQQKQSPTSPPKKVPKRLNFRPEKNGKQPPLPPQIKITPPSPPKLRPKRKVQAISTLQPQIVTNRQPTFDDILNNIRTPVRPLNDMAIDWFIDNLVNPNQQIPYQMNPTVYKQRMDKYKNADENKNDVQIIFSGHWSSLGHYTIAHYVANEKLVKMYDSLHGSGQHGRRLQTDERNVLARLYPGKTIKCVEPATKQPDGVSCGVFAVAYATTIILGNDPAIYRLYLSNINLDDSTMALREHMVRMYRNKKLLPFPQNEFINYDDLTTDAVHLYIQLVNNLHFPNMDDMIDVTSVQFKDLYARQTNNDDVQILYEGEIIRDEHEFAAQNQIIGHYICIRFESATNTVYVYDSSSFGHLNQNSLDIINLRYKTPKIQHVKVRTMQPDGLSCGAFAIANATTLILGRDPAAINYKIDWEIENKSLTLRQHLFNMIQDRQLSMFPEA